jgi:hypothetical protein
MKKELNPLICEESIIDDFNKPLISTSRIPFISIGRNRGVYRNHLQYPVASASCLTIEQSTVLPETTNT